MLSLLKFVLGLTIIASYEIAFANTSSLSELESEKFGLNKFSNKRIVTLTSLTADIVSKLDNSSLVGIPGSSLTLKNKKLSNKEIVSQGRTAPQLEKIISLEPDLVIGSASFHKKQLTKLSSLGIRSEEVEVRNWDELNNLIYKLSSLTGKNSSLVQNYLDNCNFKSDTNTNTNADTKVLVLVSAKPLLAPNSQSWAGSLLDRFNINNSTKSLLTKSQFKGYVNLSPEWLISNQPEKIIVVKTGPNSIKSFKDLPYWKKLKAVKNNNVISMDYYGLVNPGSINSINKTCFTLANINN